MSASIAAESVPETLNIAANIPPDLATADDTLTRYGRWAAGRHQPRRCGSAERSYRQESWPALEQRRQPAAVGMLLQDALTCQRALARVADLERIVLAILYVPQRLPPQAQLRMLNIPPKMSQERHLRGLRMFNNLHRLLKGGGA